jgi:carboxyl-terminal processing protease
MKLRFGIAGLALVAIASFFAGGWLLRRGIRQVSRGSGVASASPTMGTKLFQEVMRHVRSYAVDSLDEGAIYRLAASGMLDEINDPYAALVPNGDARDPYANPPLGMYLDFDGGYVVVVSVRPESPAALAGVRAGDLIVNVDGAAINPHHLDQVRRSLGRSDGRTVDLRITRPGSGRLRIEVPRDPVPAVPEPAARQVAHAIVQLRPSSMDDGAVERTRALADSAVGAGAKALILDLRGVVEGSLQGGVALASTFLPSGSLVVIRRGRERADSTEERLTADGTLLAVPLVVLIDRGTAGPAEVVAGALQDQDRALVVGESSFGRGSELSFYPLGDENSLRLTTAHWLTPSGRFVQRGLPLDEDPDDEADGERPTYRSKAGRVLKGGGGVTPDREVAAGRGEGSADDPALSLATSLLARFPTTERLVTAAQ